MQELKKRLENCYVTGSITDRVTFYSLCVNAGIEPSPKVHRNYMHHSTDYLYVRNGMLLSGSPVNIDSFEHLTPSYVHTLYSAVLDSGNNILLYTAKDSTKFEKYDNFERRNNILQVRESINKLNKELKSLHEACDHSELSDYFEEKVVDGDITGYDEFENPFYEEVKVKKHTCKCCRVEITLYPDGKRLIGWRD